MANNARVHVIIQGRVQGVCFRIETRSAARKCGAVGWVRNLPDGNVEAVLEGPAEAVDSLLSWCGQGPRMARVDKVDVTREDYTGEFDSFEVTY